jgi:putative addiction module component (TIGR02574 family)
MALPVTERAELVADLLASLDGEADPDVEAAWAAEIERRAREAHANPDDDVAWESVRAELHADSTSR